MHGTPLNVDEIATTLARQLAGLRRLDVELGTAVSVVAERHRVPMSTGDQLLVRQRRLEHGRVRKNQAAA